AVVGDRGFLPEVGQRPGGGCVALEDGGRRGLQTRVAALVRGEGDPTKRSDAVLVALDVPSLPRDLAGVWQRGCAAAIVPPVREGVLEVTAAKGMGRSRGRRGAVGGGRALGGGGLGEDRRGRGDVRVLGVGHVLLLPLGAAVRGRVRLGSVVLQGGAEHRLG